MIRYFLGIPQFEGVLWFLFCWKTAPQRNGNSTKLPPLFMGFNLGGKRFKNPHGFRRVNPPTIPPSCSLAPLTCQQVTDKSGDPCDLVRIMKGTGHISSNCGSNRSFRFFFQVLAGFPWFRNWVIITQSRVVFFKYLDFELDLFCFQLDGFESFED